MNGRQTAHEMVGDELPDVEERMGVFAYTQSWAVFYIINSEGEKWKVTLDKVEAQ